jgi:geranylgeranyl diphosphate synthase type I
MDDGDFEDRKLLNLMRIYDETCLALCEGQFLDITFERRLDVSVAEYLEMIGKKTAALLAAAVQAGALLATDDSATIEAYRRFGYNLGLAFQMADDVKGSFWQSSDSGKPMAGDVRRRKKTLPLVWALEHASEADADRLRQIYAQGAHGADGRAPEPAAAMSSEEVDEVLDILTRCGARDHTEAEARHYRDLALADLAALPVADEGSRDLRAVVLSIIEA